MGSGANFASIRPRTTVRNARKAGGTRTTGPGAAQVSCTAARHTISCNKPNFKNVKLTQVSPVFLCIFYVCMCNI